jgi:predicted transcriptional regulator
MAGTEVSEDLERRTSMLHTSVQHLLEQTIDSPVKLHICLLFCEEPHLQGTATQLANRMYRDIWSVREALHELTEDGILAAHAATTGEPVYCYHPRAERMPALCRLIQSYNEPFERDDIQRLIRDNASYARCRRTNIHHAGIDLAVV